VFCGRLLMADTLSRIAALHLVPTSRPCAVHMRSNSAGSTTRMRSRTTDDKTCVHDDKLPTEATANNQAVGGGESILGRTSFDWKHVGRNCLPRSWSCGYSRCSGTRCETVGHCDLGSSR